jgi:hypothetical protein
MESVGSMTTLPYPFMGFAKKSHAVKQNKIFADSCWSSTALTIANQHGKIKLLDDMWLNNLLSGDKAHKGFYRGLLP